MERRVRIPIEKHALTGMASLNDGALLFAMRQGQLDGSSCRNLADLTGNEACCGENTLL
jgi:hypothetical protein